MGSTHRRIADQTATPNRLRRRLLGALSGAMLAAPVLGAATIMTAPQAAAQERRPVVIELYTSQGCSSCPPADALLSELAARPDVIALSLHVDYWDYIGWKDRFADPAFTQRQKAYARQGKRRSIYTPQMIVGGVDHVVGTHPKDVDALIARHAKVQSSVDLQAQIAAGGLRIEAAPLAASRAMMVQVVRFNPKAAVKITRGENAGKTVDYANIVTAWTPVGEWDGRRALAMDLPLDGDLPAVVIVQEIAKRGPGAILAAVRVK